MTHINWYWSEI